YPNGAYLASPYRQAGDTRTEIRGPRLVGRVLTNDGRHVYEAQVAAPGTPYATTTGADGRYELAAAPWTEPQMITVSHPVWPIPSALYSVTLGPTETLPFTWTLGPRDDAVLNGEFEIRLQDWHIAAGEPAA